MSSYTLATISSIGEGNIDRDRIVDGDLVPDEYFCPICQYLLWNPRSCSSCQHLFCEKCIRTWLENPSSGKKCPFRCEPFEDRRCPPYVQSLLSRLNIHCRNSEFGCSQILSYDQLEYHENIQCKYLSQRCSECEKLVLCSKFDEHRQIAGLCIPCPIKCTICQNYIEKSLFREHFHGCCQERIIQLMQRASPQQTFQTTVIGQPVIPNNGLTFLQSVMNFPQLFEQQKQMSRLPTTLKGVDAVQRAREQNCGHFYYILIMLKFLLINWSKIPYFILMFSIVGFLIVGVLIFVGYTIFSQRVYTHVYRGSCLIMLLSYLLSYGTSVVFQFVSDKTIIFWFGTLIFLWGCTNRLSVEIFEINPLFNKTTVCFGLCCLGISIMKIILLLIRLYYWCMPTYAAASLLTFINFYLSLKVYRAYGSTITRNQ